MATGIPEAELRNAFAAPIMQHRWRDTHQLNGELRQLALDMMRGEPGLIISNVGGWSSKKDLLELGGAATQTLKQMALVLLEELMRRCVVENHELLLSDWHMEAWFNVNNPGGYNELHNHGRPPSVWSGIYYVDCGTDDPSASGRTIFENCHSLPRSHKHSLRFANPEVITPNPGTMLIFPASFFHRVDTHQGDRPRITVAFNLSHNQMALTTGPLEHFLNNRQQSRQRQSARQWMWRNFAGVMKAYRKVAKIWRR